MQYKISLYDGNGTLITSGISSVTFAATPTSVFDASVSTSGGVANVTLGMDNQTGNVALASPADGSSGQPAFRTLVAADIPNLAASKITSGQLAVARGGSGADLSASYAGHLVQITGGATFSVQKDNWTATAAPTVNDDGSVGYVVGSFWWDTTNDKAYTCLHNTNTAAVWKLISDILTTKGDLLSFSTVPARVGVGSNGQVLRANSSATPGIDWITNGGDYLVYEDQQTSGTNGGTFTSGSWQTRTLNTEVVDNGNHGSLATNQVTLDAGTYECIAWGVAFACASHQMRIQNVTDAATLLLGLNMASGTADLTVGPGLVLGVFTLAASKAIEVQHRCFSTKATNGFGANNGWGTEVYAQLLLRKVA